MKQYPESTWRRPYILRPLHALDLTVVPPTVLRAFLRQPQRSIPLSWEAIDSALDLLQSIFFRSSYHADTSLCRCFCKETRIPDSFLETNDGGEQLDEGNSCVMWTFLL